MRYKFKIMAMVNSATLWEFPPGTLLTGIFRSVAVCTSILSRPMPNLWIMRKALAFSSISPVIFVPVTKK
ncbi:hypothetical protein DCMF_20125 [Candidatus Formimonas warabiya]|uniref:Uncharacterized protein n=1 Tax=Formimonas warabiya TaxID=1761012 RepID=A0A3G1KWC1_FORW1|nr:hypothetical protein DCMF_20125 [Candidatus Formimonas warabiya]